MYSSDEIKLFGFSLFNDNELISPEWLLQKNFLVFDLISVFDELNLGITDESVSNSGIISLYIRSNLIVLYPAVKISILL